MWSGSLKRKRADDLGHARGRGAGQAHCQASGQTERRRCASSSPMRVEATDLTGALRAATLARGARGDLAGSGGWDFPSERSLESLGRSPSTVCREVNANGGRTKYRALEADRAACRRALRPKRAKLARAGGSGRVERKLEAQWSPEQISAWLAEQYPERPEMQVSHETIYQSLFVQSRGALRKELHSCLRIGRAMRRAKAYIKAQPHRSRQDQGHGDDLGAPGRGRRTGRCRVLGRRPDLRQEDDVGRHLGRAPQPLRHLAQAPQRSRRRSGAQGHDQAHLHSAGPAPAFDHLGPGMEMAQHVQFTVDTGVQIYFCDPKSPWQRGSNENTNGLLRQYLPKASDLSQATQRELDAIARSLNTWPRQTLGWMTPSQAFAEAVALIP